MRKITLLALSAVFFLIGLYILFWPDQFYRDTPGLASMGPFNLHLIRDVGLAFLASAAAVGWGTWRHQRAVVLAGSCWPALHACFHLQIWGARGFPFDYVFFYDLVAVVTPAFTAVALALTLPTKGLKADLTHSST